MNILDFANPMQFWWALAAVPIIALYILKVRLRRVPVSTLLFWNELFDEKKPTAWWQRLRHWLSLLLQLAFAALVIGALVDPLWSWQKDQQRRVVLVLDNSASMLATSDEDSTRLDEAKSAANTLVRSLRDGDQMAIVSAGGQPTVVWGMTNHARWLEDAINETPQTTAPASIEPAIELAKRLLSGLEGESEIVVLTDGCSGDVAAFQEDEQVEVYGVGTEADNVGITRYQVRRSIIDAIGYQVLVDVTNYSAEAKSCRLELDLEDSLVDVLPLELQPGETQTRIVDHTSATGGVMKATLEIDDALSTDNHAVALLPTRITVPIRLVSEGDLFLLSVLRSIPLVELSLESAFDPEASRAKVHVFDRKVPEKLPSGPVLVIDPQNDCELWKVGDVLEQPVVASIDGQSPLTQHVRLDNILFPGARRLDFTVETETLIGSPDESPLFARIARPSGDVVVLSCSLAKGDLPLRIAFPVLMKNTIERFQGDAGQLKPAVPTGEMVAIDVPSSIVPSESQQTADQADSTVVADDASVIVAAADSSAEGQQAQYQLIAPDGTSAPVAVSGGRVNVGPLQSTGLWRLTAAKENTDTAGESQTAEAETEADNPDSTIPSDENEVRIACNLVSAEESNLMPAVELPRAKELDAMLLGGRSLWFYLTLVATCLIGTEWWLFHRRIVG
ncbi:MAG: BatA and WFA domain-containing protein [Aureliella sp.]